MNSFPVLRYTSWMGHCTMETKYFSVELLPDELAAWLDKSTCLRGTQIFVIVFLKYRPLDRI